MEEVTINKVRAAINKQLGRVFPGADIYDEEIKQDLNEPAFFVALLDSSHTHELNRRYKRTHFFDIHYFPQESPFLNYHLNEVAEKLYTNMELVEYGSTYLLGENMKHEYLGGILHFFIDYTISIHKEKENIPKMESLMQDREIKEGNDG